MMLYATYPGGKGGCWRHIVNALPPHHTYVEPFLGGGSVLRNKRPAQLNVGIDRDPEVVRTWVRYMRAVWDANAGRLRQDAPRDLVDQFPALRQAPAGAQFVFLCGDALAWLEDAGRRLDAGAVVYCDPPYVHSTRKTRDLYRYELLDPDHVALLDILGGLSARVALSGYASDLYAGRLAGWGYSEFPNVTRQGASTESLWCNFAPPAVLHDYSQLGDDWRERQKLRRRARRWAGGLLRMPPLERQALLSALVEALGGEALAAIDAAGLSAPAVDLVDLVDVPAVSQPALVAGD